ncbi:AbrB/MazE/SpoVT family DNA-binding domain-containing protein [Tyzzerella sp. OttesenSCG-928-J15]|nr:AbrB/MazE/SpoVT family DNA-binding domain-containing protein [Tyzzerella sp. OttesenSCG-928-J15]
MVMTKTKITVQRGYQITLPNEAVCALGLIEGSTLLCEVSNGVITLIRSDIDNTLF